MKWVLKSIVVLLTFLPMLFFGLGAGFTMLLQFCWADSPSFRKEAKEDIKDYFYMLWHLKSRRN